MSDDEKLSENDRFDVVSLFLDGVQHHESNMKEAAAAVVTVGIVLLCLYNMLTLVNPSLAVHDLSGVVQSAKAIPAEIWGAYMKVLESNPIATKAVTSGTVYTIGDIIAQLTEGVEDANKIDRMRVIRSMTAGLIGHGPLSHFWYINCDNFFEHVLHLTAWWSFLPKIVVDQTVWGPIWNNTYLVLLGLMKRESLTKIWSDVRTSTIPLVVSGLKLWPLAHIVTYGFIPNENRLLWVDGVEILWVTILATQAASLIPNVNTGSDDGSCSMMPSSDDENRAFNH